MHRCSVRSDDEIRASSLDFPECRQPAPAGAGANVENSDVTRAVADERIITGGEMRDDDLTRHTGRQHFARWAYDFDDDVLGADMHSAAWALVGDEPGIEPPISVGDLASERPCDLRTLVIVQQLRCHERHLDADVVEPGATRFGIFGDPRQRRWIAEDHPRSPRTDLGDKALEIRLRHFERRQQPSSKHSIAQNPQPVLGSELNWRAPYDDLRVADVDAPPERRTPFCRYVMADSSSPDVEDKRFTTRSAGVVPFEVRRIVGLHPLQILSYHRFGQEWHLRQIRGRSHSRRIDTRFLEHPPVVRQVTMDVGDQSPESKVAQTLDSDRRPPLARFELAQARDGGMSLETLVERKEKPSREARVQVTHCRRRRVACPTSSRRASIHLRGR